MTLHTGLYPVILHGVVSGHPTRGGIPRQGAVWADSLLFWSSSIACRDRPALDEVDFFFITLVTGTRRSLSLKLSDEVDWIQSMYDFTISGTKLKHVSFRPFLDALSLRSDVISPIKILSSGG